MANLQAQTVDIFCNVIDNYGDVGVCWRLTRYLASEGHKVQLFIDDASALDWMATPEERKNPAISIRAWPAGQLPNNELTHDEVAADVVIEAFGCTIPDSYIQLMQTRHLAGHPSQWINLEYLSAEDYVEKNHGLQSPVLSGAGKGLTKTFFYPGFTSKTGGLLRESDLDARMAAFNRETWLARFGIVLGALGPNEQVISLFCYEPKALLPLLQKLSDSDHITHLIVTAGRSTHALQAILDKGYRPSSQLKIHLIPHLTQDDYDHLLWASDFNYVRGEDSLVRAIWAGKPFVWQIYPQDDRAHHAKLDAFLDWYLRDADAKTAESVRSAHWEWNGIGESNLLE